MYAKRNYQCHEIKSLVLKKVVKYTISILKQGQVLKALAAPLAGIDPNFPLLPPGPRRPFLISKKTTTTTPSLKAKCKDFHAKIIFVHMRRE